MANENGTSAEQPSDLEKKIIKQVEYYFGDFNIARDKFMQAQIKLDDGWIPLETMVKFNRLKQLSEDFEVIANALKKSTSGLMEVSEDKSKIRRCPDKAIPAFDAKRKEDLKNRTVYAKGFSVEMTIDDLLNFFESYGPPESIQMRRALDRNFKGSVMVLFKTKDDADNFVKAEVKYNDTDLIKYMKEDYFKMKTELKKKSKLEEVKEREKEVEKRSEEAKQKVLDRITKGAILHLNGIGEGTTREELKEAFKEHPVAWADFDKGDSEAWIRFDKENGAKEAVEGVSENKDNKITVNGSEILCDVLEGDAEFDHWNKIFKEQSERKSKKRGFGGHRGGRRRGGRDGGHGGRRDRNDDGEPANKKVKTESEGKKEDEKVEPKSEVKAEVKSEAKMDSGDGDK